MHLLVHVSIGKLELYKVEGLCFESYKVTFIDSDELLTEKSKHSSPKVGSQPLTVKHVDEEAVRL